MRTLGRSMHRRLLLLLLLLRPRSVRCQSAPAAAVSPDELVTRWLNLTTHYCKGAAPPPDHGSANRIELDCVITQLIEVNAVKQLISIESWIILQWTDRRLAWDKSGDEALSQISEIFLPMDWIWVPDIRVRNPTDLRSFEINKQLAQVQANGSVELSLAYGITTKCNMDLRDFPFDTQHCRVYFNSKKSIRHQQIKTVQRSLLNHLVTYSKNNEFCIIDIEAGVDNKNENEQPYVAISFRRRPLYYVTVLIIPSALILVTCIFGFLIPPDSGDRLALNVAILLSMSVFLQLAGSITPAQSESVPVLTWYFTVAMAVTALSTIGSIIVHLCYRRAASDEPVSSRALRLLFLNRLCGWTKREDRCGEWCHVGRVVDWLLLTLTVSSSAAVGLVLLSSALKNEFGAC